MKLVDPVVRPTEQRWQRSCAATDSRPHPLRLRCNAELHAYPQKQRIQHQEELARLSCAASPGTPPHAISITVSFSASAIDPPPNSWPF